MVLGIIIKMGFLSLLSSRVMITSAASSKDW